MSEVSTAAPRPWLFNIGWAKTGSNSLAEALRMLGVRVQHMGAAYYSLPREHDPRHKMYARWKNGDDPLAHFYDDHPAKTVIDCLIDWPIHEIWQWFFEHDPAARFLITYRNPHEIAVSWMRMAQKFHHIAQQENWATNYENIVRTAERHYSRALAAAASQPTRFLIVALQDSAEYKWRTLKQFLGAAATNASAVSDSAPWPHSFSHYEYYGLSDPE